MYADFFAFRELPFNNTPDPRFFYPTPDHEEALASLVYAVQARKGFVLLTGEIGAGKTLMTRMMLRHFGTQIAFATIHHTVQDPDDLMESICTEFELPIKTKASTTQTVRLLHDFLLTQFSQNVPVVLVLDEAQNLPVEGFEQLRMIGNLEADDAKLLQIIIVGQPELQRKFLSPELRQLRQRIFRAFHLPSLSDEATEEYIRHRLSVVTDGEVDIFDQGAIAAICHFSRGLPRLINTVCDNALLSAYSADRHTIDRPFIETIIAQMLTVGGPTEGARAEAAAAYSEQTLEPVAAPVPDPRWPDPKPLPYQPARTPWPSREVPSPQRDPAAQVGQGPAPIRYEHPAVAPVATQPQGYRERDRSVETERDERLIREKDLDAKLEKATKRLAVLEQQFRGAGGSLAEAKALYASLKPLVEQARAIVTRAETTSNELKRRDLQFRTLAATIKNAIRALRHLLDRTRDAASKTSHAEAQARALHDRLVAQSLRSRKIADNLTQLASRTVAPAPAVRSPPLVIAEASSPVDTRCDPPVPSPPRQGDPHRLRQDLHGTRDSLTELRRLVRRIESPDVALCSNAQDPPTTRLARQVEDLLDLVATGEKRDPK